MATIVNTTYLHSSAGTVNPVVSLSTSSTSGNWLVLYITADFPRQWTLVTDQGESFTNIGVTTAGNSNGGFWLCQTTQTCSSVTFTSTHIGSNKVYYVGVFETSGINLQYVNQGGINGGNSHSTHAFETATTATNATLAAMAGPSSGTTVYFSGCTAADATTTAFTITNGWTLDQTNYGGGGGLTLQSGSAYISSSGTQQPTFTRGSTSSSMDASGIFAQDSTPTLIPTTTGITSNPNPSAFGINVVFSVGISGAGTPSPSGTVTFNVDGSNVATVPAIANGAGMATASYQTSILAVGSHSVYAVYSGDSTYAGSTSPTIIQVVVAPLQAGTITTDFGNSTADVIWWHTGFTGYDEETLGNEGLINTGGTPNIPWLLGLSVSMGNAMTEAIAKQAVIYCEPEYGWDGGGGGNEAGDSQIGAGGSSNGLIVSW